MRECKGCDGTGSIGCYQRASYHAHVSRHTGHLTYFHAFACDQGICNACGGSGVVSERIPPEDALADVATVYALLPGIFWRPCEPDWEAWSTFDNWTGGLGIYDAPEFYRRGATLLFRAVPALREESR